MPIICTFNLHRCTHNCIGKAEGVIKTITYLLLVVPVPLLLIPFGREHNNPSETVFSSKIDCQLSSILINLHMHRCHMTIGNNSSDANTSSHSHSLIYCCLLYLPSFKSLKHFVRVPEVGTVCGKRNPFLTYTPVFRLFNDHPLAVVFTFQELLNANRFAYGTMGFSFEHGNKLVPQDTLFGEGCWLQE